MRAPEGYLHAITKGSQEPLFSVSLGGRVVWWGHVAESVFGYSRTEAVGRPALALVVHPQSVDVVTEAMHAAAESGAASCHPTCKTREGVALAEPLRFRIERRGHDASADLLFIVGSTVSAPEVEAREIPVNTGLPMRPLAASSPTPPPEGIETAVAHALLASHDASVLLARVGRALVPVFADAFAAFLVESDGRTRAVATVGEGLGEILVEGAAEQLNRRAEDAASATMDGANPRLLLRLLGRTRPLGSIVLQRNGDTFTMSDRAWAEGLARRLAVEVENIRLADLAQRAKEESRRATLRVQHYERLTGALSDAATAPQVLDAVVSQARGLIGADGAAIALLDSERIALEVVAASPDSEALTNAKRELPVSARVPLAEAARSGLPVVIEYVRAALPQYEHLSGLPAPQLDSALAALPLLVKGRSIGALGVRFPARRTFSVEDWTNLQALARHCADAMERVRLYEAERRARAEAGEEARRLELLSDASRILADTADVRASLDALARRLVPAVADWCAVYEAADGALVPTATFHRETAKQADLRHLVERLQPDSPSPMGVRKVLATGRPVLFFNVPDNLLPGLARDESELRVLRSVGLTSQMMVPIPAQTGVAGVLVVTYSGFRRYAANDVVFVETLARRIALALENANLLRQARESEERYRLLVEGVQDYAIFSLDPAGNIETWSGGAARVYGYEAADVVGRSHEIFYPTEAPSQDARLQRETALRDGRFEGEVTRVRKDGRTFTASILMAPMKDDTGRLRGYSVMVRDLTERVQAREELDRVRQRLAVSEKLSALGSLVSGVAHEIRTPLTAMSNNLHLLEIRIKSAAKREPTIAPLLDQVHGAIDGIDRLNRLVEDLRKFARVKAGTRAVVSLDVPVLDAVQLFSAAHRGSVDVTTKLTPTPPVEVDVLQVQQVVLNLLQNAAEAMAHGGKVVVSTAPVEGGVQLIVQDSGVGMPPQVQARMFEEFFSTKPQGTGLGLSIVRRIVESHRGTIECSSKSGQGTRFEIFFPATTAI